jgi:hypothetical protein
MKLIFCTLVLKATVRLMLAIAAANSCKVMKTDKQQAILYGDMGDYVVYISLS